MREFLTEVIYHIAKALNATRLYWYSLDRKVIYELAHNLLLQPTRYSARLSATCVPGMARYLVGESPIARLGIGESIRPRRRNGVPMHRDVVIELVPNRVQCTLCQCRSALAPRGGRSERV